MSFNFFDVNRPAEGANITGQEMRQLLLSIATMNAGSSRPNGAAVLIGDIRFSTVNLATYYTLDLTINGINQVVDLTTAAAANTAVTPAEVVQAINDAFSGSFTTPVAYVYATEALDSSSFVALIAPVSSGTSTITVNYDATVGTDAIDVVLGLSGRGAGFPYVVTGGSLPYGLSWLETTNGIDDKISIYMGTPARATSLKNLASGTGTVDLSVLNYMRIKITTTGATFGPLDVDVSGSTATATTPEEIVAAINAAFVAAPGWPSGTGPAALVTRNGTGKYLQIVSGPYDDPDTGDSVSVEISGLAVGGPFGVNFLVDDAVTSVMGLPRGEDGRKFGRVPHVYRGSDFTNAFIRGFGTRSGAGIGPWGPAMESSINIPTQGEVDGETRFAKDTGIPWIYREGQNILQGSGWRRAIPGFEFPMSYDKSAEKYRLASTSDAFIPQPLSRRGEAGYADANVEAGDIGAAVTLVDARDFTWVNGTYPSGRNPYRTAALYDDFMVAGSALTRSNDGAQWRVADADPTRLAPIGGTALFTPSSDTTAVRAYLDASGSFVYGPAGTGSATFTFTIDLAGDNIIPGSFTIRVLGAEGSDPQTTAITPAPLTYRGYDDGAGNIGGTNISSGTVDYVTGEVTVTFVGTVSAAYRVAYSYAQSYENVVAVDVYKSNAQSGGSSAEVGIIYAAKSTGTDIDTGDGFVAIIRDDGTGEIASLVGGVKTTLSQFLVDPPLDTEVRTLRVAYTEAGGNTIHTVFWDGSNKSSDWVTKDYALNETNLTASQTDGGVEVDRKNSKILTSVILSSANPNVSPHIGGTFTGVWLYGPAASGGYDEKPVGIANFQSHGGQARSFFDAIPGLPPVSGLRLRDTIGAVQLQKQLVGEPTPTTQDGIILDCTAADPFKINLGHDLATLSSIDPSTKTLNIVFNLLSALQDNDVRWSLTPTGSGYIYDTNPSFMGGSNQGKLAFWSVGDVLSNDSASGTVKVAPIFNSGQTFWFTKTYDGSHSSSIGTRITEAGTDSLPNRYYDTLTGAWNAPVYSGTSETVGFTWLAQPNWNNGSAGVSNTTVTFNTTLPWTGGAYGTWKYVVMSADVLSRMSEYRISSSNYPSVVPAIHDIRFAQASSSPYTAVTVYFQRSGAFTIDGIRLSIMAIRVA